MTGGFRRILAIALVALLAGNTVLAAGAMAYGPDRDPGPRGAASDLAEPVPGAGGSEIGADKMLCRVACLAMICQAAVPAPEGPALPTAGVRDGRAAAASAPRQAHLVPRPGPPRPFVPL